MDVNWRGIALTVSMWTSIAVYAVWGWRRMQKHPPGHWRLAYWILTLLLVRMAISFGW